MPVEDIINNEPEYQRAIAEVSANGSNSQNSGGQSTGNQSQSSNTLTLQTPAGATVETDTETAIVGLLTIQTILLLVIAIKL